MKYYKVDPKLCGEEGNMMEWAVHPKGPDGNRLFFLLLLLLFCYYYYYYYYYPDYHCYRYVVFN